MIAATINVTNVILIITIIIAIDIIIVFVIVITTRIASALPSSGTA